MPENTENITYDFPDQKKSRKGSFLAILAVIGALILGAVGGAVIATKVKDNPPVTSAFTDYCADTPESEFERSKLIYTDGRYLRDTPEQVSEVEGQHWCVIGKEKGNADMWWALVYVGTDNPIYKTMVAEMGDDDSATRAVINYQGLPPVKFARDGWVAFITPSDEPWSAFKTGAGAMLLQKIADSAAGKKVDDD